VGFRNSVCDIVAWHAFKYCVVVVVKNQVDKFVWRMVVVYGSPYEETKTEFIDELHLVMDQWQGPTLVGSGFF
jgi:hypothetical protein